MPSIRYPYGFHVEVLHHPHRWSSYVSLVLLFIERGPSRSTRLRNYPREAHARDLTAPHHHWSRSVPTTAQGADQCHGRGRARALDLRLETLRGQQAALCVDGIEVTGCASVVADLRNPQSAACRCNGIARRLRLIVEGAPIGEVVLDFGKRHQDLLAITRHRFLEHRIGAIEIGPITAAVDERHRQDGADERSERPGAARPFEKISELGRFEAALRREIQHWEEGSFGDADARVRCRHSTACRSDIGPALEQRRRQARGNRRHGANQWRRGEAERSRGVAPKNREALLDTGPLAGWGDVG